MLIQRPGCLGGGRKPPGYGSGWDVVVPSGYGLILWHNLILWGAKAGGLRETETLNRESGHDDHLPDTIYARKEAERKFAEKREKYFRMPSNKRENYAKLGIATPFRCDWQQLTTDWGGGDSPFFVVRDKEKLAIVKEAPQRKFNIRMAQLAGNSLVPVSLNFIARGTVSANSIICLPTKDDLRGFVRKLKAADHSPPCLEPVHHDPHEATRRKLRRDHQRLLRRMRNRRVRRKRRRQERAQRPVRIEPAGTAALIRAQYDKMCNLWLPGQPASVRRQCSREVFGYVSKGDFCFNEGKCTGIGYVAGGALEKLLKICTKGKVHVLVREADSQVYRFASISVRVDGI
jgi:ribonuclease P/MRP protein subunit POP1